jgi:uncharacterized protein YjbI with pentapeptide repeats
VLPPPQTLCSLAKAKGAATAFACQLRQQTRTLLDGSGDQASCDERLAKRFATAESRGGCATTGDAALASSRSSLAAADVLGALQAAMVSNDDQEQCLEKKVKLAARYATCQTAALASMLRKNNPEYRNGFGPCRDEHVSRSEALDATTDCASTSETALVQELSARGYGFFPATVWTQREGLFNELNLSNAPLAHAYLVGATFEHVGVEGADFRGADFTGATLKDFDTQIADPGVTDFRGAVFDGATLAGVRLSADLLEGVQFATATFTGVTAAGLPVCPASLPPSWICIAGYLLGPTVYMRGGDLSGLDLTGLDLSGSWLEYVQLSGAILQGADLSDSHFEYVNLDGTDLGGADLSGSTMYWLSGSSLVECPAVLPADWACVKNNLLGEYVELRQCDLAGADLAGLDMHNMRFEDCDLSGANVAGASLFHAVFVDTTCPDLTLSTANGFTCCGHHVGSPPLNCGN